MVSFEISLVILALDLIAKLIDTVEMTKQEHSQLESKHVWITELSLNTSSLDVTP